jgi:L-glutamine-phosphate cytidylyltransferase
VRVVIPAAGRGSRLAPLTDTCPKGGVAIAGRPLLWHTLGELQDAGATHVVVVCGHHGEQLRSVLTRCRYRPPLDFVTNAAYRTTNSMVSLWLTRRWRNEPFCVVDGDVLVASDLLRRVFRSAGDRVVVDATRSYADIEMKVWVTAGMISALDPGLCVERTSGEFFGISRWTPRGAATMAAVISRRLTQGGQTQWYSAAIGEVASRIPVGTVQADGTEWAEIDRPEDIPPAEQLIRDWARQRQPAQSG